MRYVVAAAALLALSAGVARGDDEASARDHYVKGTRAYQLGLHASARVHQPDLRRRGYCGRWGQQCLSAGGVLLDGAVPAAGCSMGGRPAALLALSCSSQARLSCGAGGLTHSPRPQGHRLGGKGWPFPS